MRPEASGLTGRQQPPDQRAPAHHVGMPTFGHPVKPCTSVVSQGTRIKPGGPLPCRRKREGASGAGPALSISVRR